MPQESLKTSVELDNAEARMPNDEGMPNSKARKYARELLIRWFGFRGFGLLSSFVIRHSEFCQSLRM